MDNSSVAEDHERQWQKVGDRVHQNSHNIPHGNALVCAKFDAPAFHDIRRDNDDRNHKCWDDDPDKRNCSIHETLFRTVQLQNAQTTTYWGVLTGVLCLWLSLWLAWDRLMKYDRCNNKLNLHGSHYSQQSETHISERASLCSRDRVRRLQNYLVSWSISWANIAWTKQRSVLLRCGLPAVNRLHKTSQQVSGDTRLHYDDRHINIIHLYVTLCQISFVKISSCWVVLTFSTNLYKQSSDKLTKTHRIRQLTCWNFVSPSINF